MAFKSKIKEAFTLAEILITLSIIGVIASMTIPSLVQDVQDAQYKTAWKKAYADLDQATKRILLDNAGSLKGVFTDINLYRDKYASYLNYIKKCNSGSSFGNCWANQTKYLDGTVKSDMWNANGLILNNGSSLMFRIHSAACNSTMFGSPNGKSNCADIMVDVNGIAPPNIWGKDIQMVLIQDRSLYPAGTKGDNWGNGNFCEGSKGWDSGIGCAAKYLYQ